MTEYLQLGALGVLFGSVVMVAVGVVKAYCPKVRGAVTVVTAGLLSYGLAASHTIGLGIGTAKVVEQGLIIGTVAWGAALGVSWAARLSPTTSKG